MATGNSAKNWDGTLESSTDASSWSVWDGTTALSSGAGDEGQVLYLRGTNNTRVAGNGGGYKWVLTGTDIKCQGNIENLLDYATVASGGHPAMASSCFTNLFYQCASLTRAPELPAATLATACYQSMFNGCTGLTRAPELPAASAPVSCYSSMFKGCAGLTQAPARTGEEPAEKPHHWPDPKKVWDHRKVMGWGRWISGSIWLGPCSPES